MRYEFKRQDQPVGWAQWEGPGQVAMVMDDQDDRDFFQEYFSGNVTYLANHFDGEEDALQTRRRDWTPWEFERACRGLSRQGFGVSKVATAPTEARPAAATG
jgi:hypothetical protein